MVVWEIMLINQNKNHTPVVLKKDEEILVVQRKHIFSVIEPFTGFLPVHDFAKLQQSLAPYHEFHWRSVMESDILYKQIIPYLIFEHNKQFFVMKRRENASEARLQNKYSLGIGGHIRQADITSGNILDWACREFHEEVDYSGNFNAVPLGMINDESNSVGQVHIGFVFLLRGDSPCISIKSEHKEGYLIDMQGCKYRFNELESWSQMIVSQLESLII